MTAAGSDDLSMFDTVSTLINHTIAKSSPSSTGREFDLGAAGDFGNG